METHADRAGLCAMRRNSGEALATYAVSRINQLRTSSRCGEPPPKAFSINSLQIRPIARSNFHRLSVDPSNVGVGPVVLLLLTRELNRAKHWQSSLSLDEDALRS
jgi:hypothetical protein